MTYRRTGFAPIVEAHPAPPVMDLLDPGEAIRDAALVDETGTRHRLEDWRGRVLAVTFIYTRCPLPNFCPLMDRHFRAVQEQVRADPALRGGVLLLSVSFDPEHDQPAVLMKHARQAGRRSRGLALSHRESRGRGSVRGAIRSVCHAGQGGA